MADQQNLDCIELIIFDVDGVLTDGSINIHDDGSETKRFNVRDGFGFRLWKDAGFKVAIITGRAGTALLYRLKSLGVDDDLIIQGSKDKSEALDVIIEKTGIESAQIAYMGDDWPDLPALTRVALPMCPCDAEPEVLAACRERGGFVSTKPGGSGAAREAIAHILTVKGLYST